MIRESVLNVFPSDDENSRLVIAVEQSAEGSSRLVLRQETRAAKVGWFVQSCVVVLPEQIAGLKMALSGGHSRAIQPKRGDASPVPAILSFTEAAGRVG